MTELQLKAALVLFEQGRFDTAEIATVLREPEAVVARVLTASRDVTYMLAREHGLIGRRR